MIRDLFSPGEGALSVPVLLKIWSPLSHLLKIVGSFFYFENSPQMVLGRSQKKSIFCSQAPDFHPNSMFAKLSPEFQILYL